MSKNIRGDIIARRTYCRPLDVDYEVRENWGQVVERVVNHSYTLWKEAGGSPDEGELDDLSAILMTRKHGMVAGRTLWLGGTPMSYKRPCCQFNCAFTEIHGVADVRDAFWLLLNSAGVGYNPHNRGAMPIRSLPIGTRTSIVPSIRDKAFRGRENTILTTVEAFASIQVGDSAEGWTRALEMLLDLPDTMSRFTDTLEIEIDFSECRGAGQALKGYGWMCNGSDDFARAMGRIVSIMRGTLVGVDASIEYYEATPQYFLNPIQIIDIMTSLGEVLSTRRSAQIVLMDYTSEYIEQFMDMKSRGNLARYPWRMQSNNSVMFNDETFQQEDFEVLREKVRECGIEPGVVNASAAKRRAPWFAGLNPCAEILLPDGGFCNLVEVNLASFVDDKGVFDLEAAEKVVYTLGRHNYRQSCVNLKDGILQDKWHDNNAKLRLCGVSCTGFGEYEPTDYELQRLRRMATYATYSMAMELDTPLPSNITTVKPSGTVAKVLGTSDGIHTPIGRYIFNWVCFNVLDPLLPQLEAAKYNIITHPTLPGTKLVCLPQEFKPSNLVKSEHGFEYDSQTVTQQFNRYMKVQTHWCDQNVSNTIYYKPDELDTLFDLIYDKWDDYVAFSFQPRQDLSKTKAQILEECNAPYLPQELVSEEEFKAYTSTLLPLDVFKESDGDFDLIEQEGCANGSCPIR